MTHYVIPIVLQLCYHDGTAATLSPINKESRKDLGNKASKWHYFGPLKYNSNLIQVAHSRNNNPLRVERVSKEKWVST